jgi:hypothetical protein
MDFEFSDSAMNMENKTYKRKIDIWWEEPKKVNYNGDFT